MNFENLFDGIFCSAEMGLKKPQEAYYQHILTSLNIHPSDIIYFDDTEENIEAARSLGIRSVLYRNIDDFSREISTIFPV